ncbi:hypothetical protein Baya_13944 [Bagarius yarrelli]|uniref:Uncharacterized protein n=1 Tax=Bagarius yarrelli TaxID=175774 RepID=A0A556V7R0_BAGYA|nr:hypothetical protein Baya_13944 [Bagarius yarrelli]
MNGGVQKEPLKEEEAEDEDSTCGSRISAVLVTPTDQPNGGFQKTLIKEEEADADCLYKVKTEKLQNEPGNLEFVRILVWYKLCCESRDISIPNKHGGCDGRRHPERDKQRRQ